MKKVQCSSCLNSSTPLNDSLKVEGKIYCNDCVNKEFPDEKSVENLKIEKEIDPTVCSNCQKDFGVVELDKIANHPICDECKGNIDQRIFPNWVKIFFITILLLVVFSFWWNYRFFKSYQLMQKAYASIEKADMPSVLTHLNSASQYAPEVEDIKILKSFYTGMDFMGKDDSRSALVEFERYKDKLPSEFMVDYFILQANIGIAVDNKNYEGFLNTAKESLKYDSSAIGYTFISSAYSCLYAQKNKEEYKQKAIEYINIAKSKNDTSSRLPPYYNLISYRLANKSDIKSRVFDSIYPNGWVQK